MAYQTRDRAPLLDGRTQAVVERRGRELLGLALLAGGVVAAAMLATYSPDDPSWMVASDQPAENWLGRFGASVAHPLMMIVGRAAWAIPLVLLGWGLRLSIHRAEERARAVLAPILVAHLAAAWAALTPDGAWDRSYGLGGLFGDTAMGVLLTIAPALSGVLAALLWAGALALGLFVLGFTKAEIAAIRHGAVVALALSYEAALTGTSRVVRATVAALGHGRERAVAAMARRAERVAAERALIEAEDRALRAVPAPRPAAGSVVGPEGPVGGSAGAPRAARVPVVRARMAEEGARGAPLMPPPLPAIGPDPATFDPDLSDEGWDRWPEDDEAVSPPQDDATGASGPADHTPVPARDAARDAGPMPLAAPPRARAPQPGFLSGLLRRARGEADDDAGLTASAAAEPASDDDRIRARIGEAIRARSGGPAEPEGKGLPAALAAALLAARSAGPRPRSEPPVGAPSALGAGRPAARVEPTLARSPAPGGPATSPAFGDDPATDSLADPLDEAESDLGARPDAAPDEAGAPVPPIRPPAPLPAPPLTAMRPAPARAATPGPARRAAPAYVPPPLDLLADPGQVTRHHLADDALEQNARDLEGVLEDYGVKGEITSVRPGPVVTMYELDPAPGLKASRVIGLSDDIARSMEALSARVSTVPGRSVIGIELPNDKRERVVLREILAAREYGDQQMRLPLALGKDIGGEPVIANLAKMPHLLIAGTTGSGKSVAINTMILSLLYKLTPEECRLIMIDPKMLELSVYDGIPHLLSPVVTDPKKAVVALKWVVGEMEERYRKMSKMGVRNIDGYNGRVREALSQGETFSRVVQTGFDDATGDPVFETDEIVPEVLPYIVVVVDEMADLMMVAGKEIEACIQRLAQMARASGIHLIMATQRPSVDVITGTIKANFPTRISFQVTSKIDSRTILGEQGAEQLLGQGDMLYMAGGGRITRIHGPFCSDEEVEEIVNYLKRFGPPDYMAAVLEEGPEDGEASEAAPTGGAEGDEALYDMAVQIVARDRKCSTSYIQRKLAIGYNKAARLVEQMEEQGVVTRANSVGKREILVPEPH